METERGRGRGREVEMETEREGERRRGVCVLLQGLLWVPHLQLLPGHLSCLRDPAQHHYIIITLC